MSEYPAQSQQGQALIIIIMVMVLSLATGLAVSTRSTSSIHQTANIANSEQALATAESAAEEILNLSLDLCTGTGQDDCNAIKLSTGTPSLGYLNAGGASGGCNDFGTLSSTNVLGFTSYCEKSFGTAGSAGKALVTIRNTPDIAPGSPFNFFLEKDDTQQVWVNGATVGGFNICWHKTGEPSGALEVKVISGLGPYTMSTYAFDAESGRNVVNGFSLPNAGVPGYDYCTSTSISWPSNIQALRIRDYYNGVSVSVIPNSNSIPPQGSIIVAQGIVGDVKRTVQVIKTKPQLPAVFDYGVYSGGTIQ